MSLSGSSLFSSGSPAPQLLSYLLPKLLDGDFRLENPADALAPVLLQALHLAFHLVLARRAGRVEEVHVALRGGEVALEAAQLGFEVVV